MVAQSANTVAAWCGMRDVSLLTRDSLQDEVGIQNGVADLFVLFGGGVTGIVDTLAQAMQAGVAQRYAIVGGRGRATYWLDQAMERQMASWKDDDAPGVKPGLSSEAEMLDALLWHRFGLHADFLETQSTNCGNNITYLLDLLEQEDGAPSSVILCQDAVMQRRMDATWRRQAQDRSAFGATRLVNWAAYAAELAGNGDQLMWEQAPEGVWPIPTYLQFLVGEVARLTDDELGYGPAGTDFVVHVDVPPEVRAARDVLVEWLGRGIDVR